MLSQSRIVEVGEATHYAHEREAITFVQNELPNVDPYQLWALLELLDSSTGRLYEIDLLVLGYSALYLVEIKSAPGRYEGDQVDWSCTPTDGKPHWMDPPLRLANHKAKILKSRLAARMKSPQLAPRVEPLVFLSHPDTEVRLSPDGQTGVLTRKTMTRALTHHEFPGAPKNWAQKRIDAPLARDITQALAAIGIRPRKGKLLVGSYEIRDMLEDGSGYQDRLAIHQHNEQFRRRARIYLVPQQTSVERRQQLRRAADREAQLLYEVREHPHILDIIDYLTDPPLGPTVLFDAFDGGIPLDAFLRKNPELTFGERVLLIEQIGRALAFCHKKDIVHGALGPHAVLVRRNAQTGVLETRLFGFMLGAGRDVEATSHWSALASEPWALYQAPELRHDPSSLQSPQVDIYGLGAIMHLVFTGRPPGESVAAIDERLERDRWLDPRIVIDGVHESVVHALEYATDVRFTVRYDDVGEWLESFLEEATAPTETPAAEIDPLEARKEDRLGDLLVTGVLGHGATSRVLAVQGPEGKTYALKVPLSADHDERFAAEGKTLAVLRHPRIVQFLGERSFSGRSCLLLSLAGEQTLQRLLAKEGTITLDFASRYGEDLLVALEELEEKRLVHRDIKPANLGVSAEPPHLTLFDFSLVHTSNTEIKVGTAVYRDPFLLRRGAWDHAADRWSAAMTLHEMLTGIRPILVHDTMLVSAERFDPAVRERLSGFFAKAFASDADARHPTAKAMKYAWMHCFDTPFEPTAKTPVPSRPLVPRTPTLLSDADLAAIVPETPLEALPLSPRARNALDRAGVLCARDLLDIPDNRFAAMRGVGQFVAREIADFRRRWQKAHALAPQPDKPFFPAYRGDDTLLVTMGLDAALSHALNDAGLRTLVALAGAPEAQVLALAKRHNVQATILHELLDKENRAANERARPSTLEGWIDALVSKPKKTAAYIRALYGLDEPFLGRIDVAPIEVAKHHGVTRANVYLALQTLREKWLKHPSMGELREAVFTVLELAGGGLPLPRVGEELLARFPHHRSVPPAVLVARGVALLRVVLEVERQEDGADSGAPALEIARMADDVPWLVASKPHGEAIAALGRAADDLAARAIVASPGEAARTLAEIVRDTPLASMSPERLVDLAALASTKAARSTRLELYPRGMPAERALELSASAVLTAGLAPDEVLQRVAARYPDAEPLPTRPELDRLLRPHGLVWVSATNLYERPGERHSTTLETSFTSSMISLVPSTRLPARIQEPQSMAIIEFEDRLRNAVDRRHLRILGVTADKARETALALGKFLGVEPLNLDAALIAGMRRLMKHHGIDAPLVFGADREGPANPGAWANLVQLATLAAEDLARSVLPPKRPLLLVQPGLVARYRLEGFVEQVVEVSRRDESAAIFWLVPSLDTGGIPRINADMSIRGILPSQSLWVPTGWPKRTSDPMVDAVGTGIV